jgi:polygalacturonase
MHINWKYVYFNKRRKLREYRHMEASVMEMINIIDFGVREKVVQTKAIQNALDFADEHGGLTVKIPSGTFITGTLNLGSASLYLEKGAVLLASDDPEDYYENGFEHNEMRKCISLLFSLGQSNISIWGEGTIDLNAGAFYNREERQIPDYDVEFKKEQIEGEIVAPFRQQAGRKMVQMSCYKSKWTTLSICK